MYDSNGSSANPYATGDQKAIGLVSLVIFNFLVALGLAVGMYRKKDPDGSSRTMWKKFGQMFALLFVAEIIVALLFMFVFRVDFFVVFFFGGQIIGLLARLFAAVVVAITAAL